MSSTVGETVTRDITEPAVFQVEQPEWLLRRRRDAWQAYNDMPLPGRVENLWRYTDPALFLYASDVPSNGEAAVGTGKSFIPDHAKKELDAGSFSGIIYNDGGKGIRADLSPELKKAGVIIGDTTTIIREKPGLVEPYLGKLVGAGFGKFEALNLATWASGIYVRIPRGVTVRKPLYLLTDIPASGHFTGRTIVVMEEGSSLPLIDEHRGGTENPGTQYVNFTTETYAETASHLRHLFVQNLNNGARYLLTHRSDAGSDARIFTGIVSLGAHTTKSNFGTNLTGRGSESALEGFLLGEKRQRFDHYTVHKHYASNTLSNLQFKVVLKDRSQSAYTGKIIIDNHAPFSEAYQENRNLLLSPKCRAESIPELEINQDEVRCSHGAAMGPPNPDELFYLESRGIPENEAVQLIVEGFMEEALKRVPPVLREHVQRLITQRLKGGWTFE